MPDFVRRMLASGDYMPHGHCYLWEPGLVRLHLISDLLIGLSYVAISLTLVYMVRRARRDIPFHWMFIAFGAFIIACGGTHLMEVWTMYVPLYWLSGYVKAVTAVASVTTAFALPPLVPRTLRLIRASRLAEQRKQELEALTATLQAEVAERKRAEEQVRSLNRELEARVAERTADVAANEAKLRAIIESASQGILGIDAAGTIHLVNAKTEEMFGYSRDELLGSNLSLLLPARYRDIHSGHQRQYFEAPKHRPMGVGLELTGLKKDGSEFPLEISLSYVDDGHERLGLALITDITDRKRIEEQLRETAKLESLGVLAGGIAHDFNNLLVGIMGNASLALEAAPPGSRIRPMLEGVVKASERAADLIRQLLAYSGKGRFVIQPVSVSELIRETVGLIHASVPKTVELRLELADALPPIDADPAQLQQLIMNLVINGAESIGDHNGTVWVRTALREDAAAGRFIQVQVQDNGSGMDDATKERIFDPFFTTKFTGRGLGLAAALGIVRGHGGSIYVDSEPGKGSTFTVVFPEGNSRARIPPAAEPFALEGRGTVLVVDDEEIVRTSARLALERYGYQVLVAENGLRAAEILERSADEVALVVLDLTMPVMSGEEALRRIRELAPDVPVILSSGYNQVEAIRRFQGKGLAGFLQKPYTSARLAEVVNAAFRPDPRL